MVCAGLLFNLFVAFALNKSNAPCNGVTKEINTTKHDNACINALVRLRSIGMDKKELPCHVGLPRASVLVPLFERDNLPANHSKSLLKPYRSNLHVLFTQRPQTLSSHGGEVCFPGGRQDLEDDGDDVLTALREAQEEIGLHPRYVDVIGRLKTVESRHSLCVTPIVGLIRPSVKAEPSRLQLNANEVESSFAVPLEYFIDPMNCVSETYARRSHNGVLTNAYMYNDPDNGKKFKIWGLTAYIVSEVANAAFNVTGNDKNKSIR